MDRNVLVDGNNILHQAHHVFVKNVSDPFVSRRGYPTGLIYGVLNMVSNWVSSIDRFTHLRFFLDGRPIRRKILDSEYKVRESDGLDMSRRAIELCDGYVASGEVDVLCHILHLLGAETYQHPDEEADDLIATFVKKNEGNVSVIVSSDRDFYQLLTDIVVQYRPCIKGNRFFDAERVKKETGVFPPQIRLFKSMVSDTSDNIPGVPRVRKKVIASLCDHGSLDAIFQSDMKPCSAREKQKILDYQDRIRLNFKLVGMIDDLDLDSMRQSLDPDPDLARKILSEDLDIGNLDSSALVPKRIGTFRSSSSVEPPSYFPTVALDKSWLSDI